MASRESPAPGAIPADELGLRRAEMVLGVPGKAGSRDDLSESRLPGQPDYGAVRVVAPSAACVAFADAGFLSICLKSASPDP